MKSSFVAHKLLNLLPDVLFIKMYYYHIFKKRIDLKNPNTFNEKLQWLKLHERKELYTQLADKIEVRKYVGERIGEQYLIPVIGTWDSPDDIDFGEMPDQFVLKCNHNSGRGMYICRDKSLCDYSKVVSGLKEGLKENYYITTREWPYKNIRRRILGERYLENDNKGLDDYKIHCFNDKAKVILVCKDRFLSSGLTEDFFDVEWNHLDVKRPKVNNSATMIEKPKQLDLLVNLAEKLATGIPFVRVDFYISTDTIYFGEMTFFPAGGFVKFEPESFDRILGDMLEL